MKARVISWNILNDYWSIDKKYPIQKDRLSHITRLLKKTMSSSEQVIVFLCELNEENVKAICKETGLVVVDDVHRYERLAQLSPPDFASQHAVFLTDRKTAEHAKAKRLRTESQKRDIVLMIEVGGKKLVGTHIPQRPFTDYSHRREHTETMLAVDPDIVMGDFNATPAFPTRWRFLKKKYKEVHRSDRPMFPEPYFRNKNIAWYWPKMNIDVMYAKPALAVSDKGYASNQGSDHPLIWADIEL